MSEGASGNFASCLIPAFLHLFFSRVDHLLFGFLAVLFLFRPDFMDHHTILITLCIYILLLPALLALYSIAVVYCRWISHTFLHKHYHDVLHLL